MTGWELLFVIVFVSAVWIGMLKNGWGETKLDRIYEASKQLYYAGKWHLKSDRYTENGQDAMWKELRDAAGFEKGNSPK